jgi:hypothetical protein
MPAAQSPDHYINSGKGCPSKTGSFPLVGFLVLCATVAALLVVQPHWSKLRSLNAYLLQKSLEKVPFCHVKIKRVS